MSSFSFEYPWVLVLIPVVIFCFIKCKAKDSALIFPHLKLLKTAGNKKRFLLDFLKYSATFLLIVSIASPVRVDNNLKIKNVGYDIALAIDASGSMKEKGFDRENLNKTKFDVVKELVKDFVSKRANDNIALVVFGSFAYVSSPLTFNKNVLKKIIDYLQIGIAGQKTAILDAAIQAISLLEKGEAKSKILILLTDGIDTASRVPLDIVLKMAKKHNIKVYTIGIGEKEDINIPLLKKIAKKTKGEFFYAKNALALKEVYKQIDRLEKSEIEGEKFVKKEHLYSYILFISILCLLLYIYIYGRRGV